MEEPKTKALLAGQANRMRGLFGAGAAGWMMGHDEVRVMGWRGACEGTHRTPGESLAANVRECVRLLGDAPVYAWSDMFDPFHNAVRGPYYLVNGSLEGAWEGLSASVVIVNWNHGHREESARFFAGRGHGQAAAAYCGDASLGETRDWIAAAKGQPSVIGFMCASWRNDYSKPERFASLARTPRGRS